ncbi:MAG: hypothetical protein ABI851_10840 [Saprospiraceae bacterium]
MGQQVWNMQSISGDHYCLGLYHNEDSGNLMLYLNSNIFLIDFFILDDKTFQFYIGNEFMKLNIIKSNEIYIYELKVDLESPTPLNIAMSKNEENEQKSILFGLIVFCIVLLLVFIYNFNFRYK